MVSSILECLCEMWCWMEMLKSGWWMSIESKEQEGEVLGERLGLLYGILTFGLVAEYGILQVRSGCTKYFG